MAKSRAASHREPQTIAFCFSLAYARFMDQKVIMPASSPLPETISTTSTALFMSESLCPHLVACPHFAEAVSGRRGDALLWGPWVGEVAAGGGRRAGRRAPPPPPLAAGNSAESPLPQRGPSGDFANSRVGGTFWWPQDAAAPFVHPRARCLGWGSIPGPAPSSSGENLQMAT